ncbi:hypothetical protein [Petrachloros mirabilis]
MQIRDRIKELRRVRAGDLLPNPRNWRTHPQAQQDALRGVLAEIGYADALLVRELPDGSLLIIDGHLRAETTPDEMVPVLVLDVDEIEADKLLLTLDPLATMAEENALARESLAAETSFRDRQLAELFGSKEGDAETVLKSLSMQPPPPMTWVLIGVPTVKYGDIAEHIEVLAESPDTIVETTVNDG